MKFTTPPSLTRLREATRTVHKSLETLTNSDELLYSTPDLKHYQSFLAAQYVLHRAVESRTTKLLERDPLTQWLDWPDCQRTRALEADLQTLAFNTEHDTQEHSPDDSHAKLLGLVYVCEGSCIGNQRLFTALNKHENFREWRSSEFLRSCKSGFSERWKPVVAAIDTLATQGSPVDGSGYDDIEQGALEGFDIFKSSWNAISAGIAPR